MKTLTRQGIQRMTTGGTTVVGGSGSGSGGSGGGSADYAAEAGHAQTADEATHATSSDSATTAATATNLDANSTDWQKIARKDIAQSIAEVFTFAKGIVSTLVSKFKAGILIGANDQFGIDANGDATLNDISGNDIGASGGINVTGDAGIGGDLGVIGEATIGGDTSVGGDITVTGNTQGTTADFTDVTMDNLGKTTDKVANIHAVNMNTENLTVTKDATFFRLVVSELASNKGAIIISNANCVAEIVVADAGHTTPQYYDVYFSKTDKNGNAVINPWQINDQAICMTFTGQNGSFSGSNVKNRYYWRLVTNVSDDSNYPNHYRIRLSNLGSTYSDGSTVPAAGDEIVQLGYRGTTSGTEYRKSAVILSAYPTPDTGLTPASLAFYQGINDFALASHRKTYLDALSNEFIGNFKVLVGGSYQSLTTVLATMEGLISNVQKVVGHNLLSTEGWINGNGVLIDGFDESQTKYTVPQQNTNVFAAFSPLIYLSAGKYCFSWYGASSAQAYIYSSTSKPTQPYMNPAMTVTGLIIETVSGDTYAGETRRYGTFELQNGCYVYLHLIHSATFSFCRPMLQTGETPTEWDAGQQLFGSIIQQTAELIRAQVGSCGLDLTNEAIIAHGGKFKMQDQNGNDTFVLDQNGNLVSQGSASFAGTVRATTLYRSFKAIPITSGMAGLNGNVLTLATYLASISEEMPDVMFFYTAAITNCYVHIPPASDYQGKMITIYGMYDWSGYKLVNVNTLDGNGMCYITGVGYQMYIRFNNTQSSNYQTGYVTLLSAYDTTASAWKWHIMEVYHADVNSA